MNIERKNTIIIIISSFFILSLLLFLIYIEEKNYQTLRKVKVIDRPAITNQDTNFERPELMNINKNLEEEIYDNERISKISDFLNNIYKINRSKSCNLTNVIFKGKSGKISLEELYRPNNLELLSNNESSIGTYNYEKKEKNDIELKIENYMFSIGKKKDISYKIINVDSLSLKYFEDYYGININPHDIELYSDIENKVLFIGEKDKILTFVGFFKEDKKCNEKEIKEIIRVTEDSEYIYVYVSYLKYNDSVLKEIYAKDKAISDGPNYRILLKKNKDRYYLNRYEYLK